ERTRTADGGYTERHDGPNADDKYTVTRTKDGHFLITGSDGKTVDATGKNDLRVERSRLDDALDHTVDDPDRRQRMRDYLGKFEQQSAERGVPPEERARFMSEITRLNESTGDKPFNHDEKLKLSEQLITQAASPETVSQGHHNTCNVTTL